MIARYQIELECGRTIHLRELRQSFIYEGLLEGRATAEVNRRHLDWALQRERAFDPAVPLHLLQTHGLQNGLASIDTSASQRFPSILCLARFRAWSPADDLGSDYSEVVFAWLQSSFALPITEEALAFIKKTDWGAVSASFLS